MLSERNNLSKLFWNKQSISKKLHSIVNGTWVVNGARTRKSAHKTNSAHGPLFSGILEDNMYPYSILTKYRTPRYENLTPRYEYLTPQEIEIFPTSPTFTQTYQTYYIQ